MTEIDVQPDKIAYNNVDQKLFDRSFRRLIASGKTKVYAQEYAECYGARSGNRAAHLSAQFTELFHTALVNEIPDEEDFKSVLFELTDICKVSHSVAARAAESTSDSDSGYDVKLEDKQIMSRFKDTLQLWKYARDSDDLYDFEQEIEFVTIMTEYLANRDFTLANKRKAKFYMEETVERISEGGDSFF